MIHFSQGVSIPNIDTYQLHGNFISVSPISLVCALSSFAFIVEPMCCEQQRERAAQPSKEPQRGVNSVNGKVKRNHLNTPRYEYSDVYTHGD